MPARPSGATMERLWTLLRALPNRPPGRKLLDLVAILESAGYKISKRQVERDLKDLSVVFPLCSIENPSGWTWHWDPKAQVLLADMSNQEAMSLIALERMIKGTVPNALLAGVSGRFLRAADQISALPAAQNAIALGRVRAIAPAHAFLPPSLDESILDKLYEALLGRRKVEVVYRTDLKLPVLLNPLGVLHRGPVSYLLATVADESAPRLYALHRIRSVKLSAEDLIEPPDFCFDTWLEQGHGGFGQGQKIDLKLRVNRNLANVLEEAPFAKDQVVFHDEQDSRIEVTVYDNWQLRWWLLSHADELTIVAPQELRDAHVRRLVAALDRYNLDDRRSLKPMG